MKEQVIQQGSVNIYQCLNLYLDPLHIPNDEDTLNY
jgi:hypothetical protein